MGVVHTDDGNWIGEAEHVPLDQSVRGNDCTVIIISSQKYSARSSTTARRPAVSEEDVPVNLIVFVLEYQQERLSTCDTTLLVRSTSTHCNEEAIPIQARPVA